MPLVAQYSEDSLKTRMITELSAVATALGWITTSPEIVNAVSRTARLLGAEIAAMTDMDALEAVADWQAWEAAVSALVTRYDQSTDGQSLSRSQMFTHADTRRVAAKLAAMGHTPAYSIGITPLRQEHDIYTGWETTNG